MLLTSIDRVSDISHQDFREYYLKPQKPVIITGLSRQWPAYEKWTWDYFKGLVGNTQVGVYNNIRAGAKVPVNGADGYMSFGEYIDLIQKGAVELRIFLFNIFNHAPQINKDFTYPEHLMGNFLKRYPMLFIGGAGSIAHMHYDIDLSHIIHTQYLGRKRVLLFKNDESPLIYRMPLTVESAASFVKWNERLDTDRFPALQYAHAYHTILEHGDTMFMPSGYWHHMEYIENGFAMSIRAIPEGVTAKLNGLYHLFGKRGLNNLLIRLLPEWWYHYKRRVAHTNAEAAMKKVALPQLS